MRIHTDHNGVAVNAISTLADGSDVEGHLYQVLIGPKTLSLEFQNGPVKEAGVNGLTNEALLAVLAHRIGELLLGIFLPDPNELTAEDREIMEREQAEADAAERRAKGVGQ